MIPKVGKPPILLIFHLWSQLVTTGKSNDLQGQMSPRTSKHHILPIFSLVPMGKPAIFKDKRFHSRETLSFTDISCAIVYGFLVIRNFDMIFA
ncbi:hypothetical protein H5410_042206 [Solanum commersonii]|uniref:Uncharacterized protein n=1 Tax=Solanum commersonii TaxID=4109 RepID=A0A9J5XWX0_SOLCO|nr:hypothetical protein H5410_042206 [Solanum commersonii]